MLLRRAIVFAVVISLTSLGTPARAAIDAQKLWSGKWFTEHEFGNPTLLLVWDDGRLTGTYRDNGRVIGSITGTISERGREWTGTYREYAGGVGKFSVRIGTYGYSRDDDYPEFKGTFRPCGAVCTPLDLDYYTWWGEKATKYPQREMR